MSETARVTKVVSEASGTPGRSLNHARQHHVVMDEPESAGGPGEALSPEESFLGGVSACGVMLVERFAAEAGDPLAGVEVEIRGVRDADHRADYRRVEMDFRMTGIPRERAEQLVERFRGR